ncbi:10640_t:CDS:10 [Entrophospora sp. SA101]|nr:10640_t:CDS:10 [Entrophospora sp. SA101]
MSTTESLSENGVSREALNENSHNIIFQTIVSEWVEDYRNDNVGALLVLINFIIRSCGCNNVVHKDAFKDEEDKDRIDDEDIIVDVLEELKNSLKKELLSDYPLVSKSKDYKKFRKNFLDFFHKLIKQVKHSELYQGVFCENIQAWISIMSNSGYRPFRHTATAVSLNIVTGLCEVAFDVKQEYNIAERQLTLEQSNNKSSRNTKNKDRISSLVTKTDELKGKERIINSYIQGFFDSVFMHRYRDVEPVIRSECIKELGVWVIKHPDYFLNDTYIRYLGWQLSDKSPLTRQESVKALSRLYNHETFANDLRNFTERFKPRLLEMALRESDIIVRAATINLVTLINEIDLLDRDYRNKFSVLIYSDITKVRKSIAPFIKNVLEEDFVKDKLEKVRIFLSGGSSNTNTNASSGSKRKPELLVKYGKAVEDSQENDDDDDKMSMDSNDDNDPASSEIIDKEYDDNHVLTRNTGSVKNGRIGLAIEDLWTELDILHNWQSLAEYLSKDHSLPNSSKTKMIEECYRLSEQEESVLIQVLVSCLKLSLTDTPLSKKRTEAQIEEIRTDISRTMVNLLPRFLTKYAPDAGRIAETLQILPLMNVNVYSDLRMTNAFEKLVEDIKKLFLKHTHSLVLERASVVFQYLTQYESFKSTTEANLSELQEEVIKTFQEECADKNLLTVKFTSDQVHSRGLLRNVGEEKIISSAIGFLWYFLLWKVDNITPKDHEMMDISVVTFNDLIDKREQIVNTLFELGISTTSEALRTIKTAAFKTLGNIYWLFSSNIFHSSNGPSFSKMRLICSSEVQENMKRFVKEEIERFRGVIKTAQLRLAEVIQNDEDEDEEASDQEAEKLVKKSSKNVEALIDPEERLKFMEIVGTLLRGVRGGWFQVEHSAVIISQFGTLGSDLDEVIKKLLQDFKERISGGEASVFANVCIESLKKSHQLYMSGRVQSMYGTSLLARICANILQVRDNNTNNSRKGINANTNANSHLVRLHRGGIIYVWTNIHQLTETKNFEAIIKMLKFFKILSLLVGGMNSNDADRIKKIAYKELTTHKVKENQLDKNWCPFYVYLDKLSKMKGGSKKGKCIYC